MALFAAPADDHHDVGARTALRSPSRRRRRSVTDAAGRSRSRAASPPRRRAGSRSAARAAVVPRWSRRRTWRGRDTDTRRTTCTGCRCCAPRSASSSRIPHGAWNGWYPPCCERRRRAAGCEARATPPATGTACSSAPRSGLHRGCRAPGRATRPSCSRARSRRTTAATPATARRRACSSPKSCGSQPVQRGAVQLGRAADEVVHLRLERGAVGVVPRVGRDVPAVDEHRVGIPVRHLARQEVAPFEQQDALPRRREACAPASHHPRRCR